MKIITDKTVKKSNWWLQYNKELDLIYTGSYGRSLRSGYEKMENSVVEMTIRVVSDTYRFEEKTDQVCRTLSGLGRNYYSASETNGWKIVRAALYGDLKKEEEPGYYTGLFTFRKQGSRVSLALYTE